MTSVILDIGMRAVFHTTLLFSVYLLFAGHNQPGGGFIGGLVGGIAFVLWYIAEGEEGLERVFRLSPVPLLGLGVLLALLTGLAGFLLGGAFLASDVLHLSLPVLGTVHVTSVLVFDVGVYLVVVGLTVMALRTVGARQEW